MIVLFVFCKYNLILKQIILLHHKSKHVFLEFVFFILVSTLLLLLFANFQKPLKIKPQIFLVTSSKPWEIFQTFLKSQ